MSYLYNWWSGQLFQIWSLQLCYG